MKRVLMVPALVIGILLLGAGPASAFNPDTLVTVGSPTTPFSQNKQNEPSVARSMHVSRRDASSSDGAIESTNDCRAALSPPRMTCAITAPAVEVRHSHHSPYAQRCTTYC